MRAVRKFTVEFKRQIVEDVQAGVMTTAQAIRQHELSPSIIYRWKDHYKHGKLNHEATKEGALENKIAELERKVGQQAMELDLLKKAQEQYRRSLSANSSMAVSKGPSKGGAQ
jgi:putative transposase